MSHRKNVGYRRDPIEALEPRELLTFGLIGKSIDASASVPFSGQIGYLGNLSPAFKPGDITINWGDGSAADTTTGSVVSPTSINLGVLQVDGSHLYKAAGSYTVTFSVTDTSDQGHRERNLDGQRLRPDGPRPDAPDHA